MNCDEFREHWNQRLDLQRAGLEAIDAEERALASAHTSGCPACRNLDIGFLELERAISTLPPVPAHQPALTARTLDRLDRERANAVRWPLAGRSRVRLAGCAAAAVVLAGFVAVRWGPRDRFENGSVPVTARRPDGPKRPLEDVLADAASATMALARETSAPAARLGRDVIDSASRVTLPNLDSADSSTTAGEVATATVLEKIGQGVRPLGEPARNAFSFLIPRVPTGPATTPPDDRARGT